MLLTEGLAHILNLGYNLTRTWCGWKFDIERCQVLLLNLDALQTLQLLDA